MLENEVITQDVSESEVEPKGILYDYKQKYDVKQAKKEKRKNLMQFIKYALCAASAGIIQIVSFAILQAVIPQSGKTIHFIVEDMELVTFISTTVALCLSILWNFTLNRKFTFKDAGNVPLAMILAFIFYVPFYPFQTWYVHTVKTGLMPYMSLDLAGIIAEATVMIINFVLEFFWQKFVVFRKKKGDKKDVQQSGENDCQDDGTERDATHGDDEVLQKEVNDNVVQDDENKTKTEIE